MLTEQTLGPATKGPIATADILVVDDTIASLRLLTEILTSAGYRVRPAERPQLALDSALAHPPSLILLDVKMPEMSGFELCRRLKEDARTQEIPVIFVSALQEVDDRVQGFEAGGVDFISKPFQESEVLARVRTHLQLRTMQLHLEELVAARTAELRAANQALGESEEKFRTVVEQALEGILVMQDRHRKYYNPALLTISGYTAAEYAAIPFLALVHADDLEIAEEVYRNSISGRALGAHDIRMMTKSGRTKWVSIRGSTIEWEGQPAGMVFVEDISARKQTEQTLHESEEKFRTLVTNTEEIVYMIAKDGEFLLSEGRGLVRLGLKPGEIVGKSVFDLYEDYPEMLAAMSRAFRGVTITIETRIGDLYFRNWYTPHIDRAGEIIGLMGLSINITERKLAELEVQAYQQRLKALAAQLTLAEEQERRRIAADLHDDVGQTLAFARIQLATARKAASEARRNALLDDTSQTLRQIIQTTRSLVFDLSSPLLNEIGLEAALTEWMEEKIGRQHGLNVELIDDGAEKPLNKDMRVILFRNVRELLINVVKHTHAENVIVRIARVRDTIEVSVEDDGNGMDIHAVAQRTRREGGFGLLSIQERMSDLGGALEIVSVPGEGSTATLTAPLAFE